MTVWPRIVRQICLSSIFYKSSASVTEIWLQGRSSGYSLDCITMVVEHKGTWTMKNLLQFSSNPANCDKKGWQKKHKKRDYLMSGFVDVSLNVGRRRYVSSDDDNDSDNSVDAKRTKKTSRAASKRKETATTASQQPRQTAPRDESRKADSRKDDSRSAAGGKASKENRCIDEDKQVCGCIRMWAFDYI